MALVLVAAAVVVAFVVFLEAVLLLRAVAVVVVAAVAVVVVVVVADASAAARARDDATRFLWGLASTDILFFLLLGFLILWTVFVCLFMRNPIRGRSEKKKTRERTVEEMESLA